MGLSPICFLSLSPSPISFSPPLSSSFSLFRTYAFFLPRPSPLSASRGGAGSDAARVAEVRAWVAAQYEAAGRGAAPEMEFTPRGVAHLHTVASRSQPLLISASKESSPSASASPPPRLRLAGLRLLRTSCALNSIVLFSPAPTLSVSALGVVRPASLAVSHYDPALSAVPLLRAAIAEQTSVASGDASGGRDGSGGDAKTEMDSAATRRRTRWIRRRREDGRDGLGGDAKGGGSVETRGAAPGSDAAR